MNQIPIRTWSGHAWYTLDCSARGGVTHLTSTGNEIPSDGRLLGNGLPKANSAAAEQLTNVVQTREDESMVQTSQVVPTKKGFFLPQLGNKFVTADQVTVVIPALNEREGIERVLDDLRREGFGNILVIDGYSTDGTAEIAEAKGAAVLRQHGKGKAGALATAIDVIPTPYMVVMDADDTYKAADISRLLAHAAYYDEVIGARTVGRKNIPRFNRFGNWLISKMFKLLFDQPVTDVLSGMYLVESDKVRDVKLTTGSFDVEIEIASSIANSGRITEVPISYGERVGTKKLRTRDGGRIFSTLFWMAYYYNPLLLFGGLISLTAIPAVGILSWTLYEREVFNVWHSSYALFGGILLLVATQSAALSLGSLLTKRSENRLMAEIRRTRQRA